MIFNFGYLGTNKKQSADLDLSCHKYPILDDTPLPFGHRKIMPDQGNGSSDHTAENFSRCRSSYQWGRRSPRRRPSAVTACAILDPLRHR